MRREGLFWTVVLSGCFIATFVWGCIVLHRLFKSDPLSRFAYIAGNIIIFAVLPSIMFAFGSNFLLYLTKFIALKDVVKFCEGDFKYKFDSDTAFSKAIAEFILRASLPRISIDPLNAGDRSANAYNARFFPGLSLPVSDEALKQCGFTETDCLALYQEEDIGFIRGEMSRVCYGKPRGMMFCNNMYTVLCVAIINSQILHVNFSTKFLLGNIVLRVVRIILASIALIGLFFCAVMMQCKGCEGHVFAFLVLSSLASLVFLIRGILTLLDLRRQKKSYDAFSEILYVSGLQVGAEPIDPTAESSDVNFARQLGLEGASMFLHLILGREFMERIESVQLLEKDNDVSGGKLCIKLRNPRDATPVYSVHDSESLFHSGEEPGSDEYTWLDSAVNANANNDASNRCPSIEEIDDESIPAGNCVIAGLDGIGSLGPRGIDMPTL